MKQPHRRWHSRLWLLLPILLGIGLWFAYDARPVNTSAKAEHSTP